MSEGGAITQTDSSSTIAQIEKAVIDLSLSLQRGHFPRDLRGRLEGEKRRLGLLRSRLLEAKRDRVLLENKLR